MIINCDLLINNTVSTFTVKYLIQRAFFHFSVFFCNEATIQLAFFVLRPSARNATGETLNFLSIAHLVRLSLRDFFALLLLDVVILVLNLSSFYNTLLFQDLDKSDDNTDEVSETYLVRKLCAFFFMCIIILVLLASIYLCKGRLT